LRDRHLGYNSKKYYDDFLLVDKPVCKICSNPTTFQNINIGYSHTCSHVCSGKYHRQNLSADVNKHDKFRKKVAENQKNIWQTRKKNGTATIIHKKVGDTIKELNSQLSPDELKEKYGWLNKLSPADKTYWINTVMLKTGMYKWWNTTSDTEINKVVTKRNAAKLGISVTEYESRFDDITSKEQYYYKVWYLTKQNYKKYKNEIDPHNLRSPEYHLDHKYSVIRGFHNNIDPEIIASKFNLEMLTRASNSKKSGKCSLRIDILQEMYHAQFL
jgi:hypothetical protein